MTREHLKTLLRLAGSMCAVLLCTWIDFKILHVNSATAAFTFLLLVLFLAARAGLRESVLASIASMLAYNFFFLPPVGTLTISDPQNWVALFAFLAVAITASQLSASARRKAEESASAAEELRRLYDFSRSLILSDPDRPLISNAAHQLHETFAFSDVSFFEKAGSAVYHSSLQDSPVPEATLRRVAASGEPWREEARGIVVVPLSLGGQSFGSMAVRPESRLSPVALTAVAQLVTIALERVRALRSASLLEAARENEHLKSTLLDALAHEFKTPLTSVKAATTSLLSRTLPQGFITELVTVIDEEADRMNKLVSDSIELARVGAGRVNLNQEWIAPQELIDDSLASLRPVLEGREVQVDLENSLPLVHVDSKLTGLALRQVLGNAAKYSPAGSPLRISGRRLDSHFVEIQVVNEGPGIPNSEKARVFEKFYRGREVRNRVPGTGLGLNITQSIIQAQGGRIWISSEASAGAEFFFTLPAFGTRSRDPVPPVAS